MFVVISSTQHSSTKRETFDKYLPLSPSLWHTSTICFVPTHLWVGMHVCTRKTSCCLQTYQINKMAAIDKFYPSQAVPCEYCPEKAARWPQGRFQQWPVVLWWQACFLLTSLCQCDNSKLQNQFLQGLNRVWLNFVLEIDLSKVCLKVDRGWKANSLFLQDVFKGRHNSD